MRLRSDAASRRSSTAASGAAVVLVIDGEETCECDRGKVIEALQTNGLQINLNIVGFAIDNVEIQALSEMNLELQ